MLINKELKIKILCSFFNLMVGIVNLLKITICFIDMYIKTIVGFIIFIASVWFFYPQIGAMYFIAVICFLNGISDFNFEIFSNANPEELKLMLKIMIQAFILLGILLTILEYFFKHFSKEPCSVTVHKLKPTGKAKEIKKI